MYQKNHNNRYLSLDYMKGIGIILVVFGHLLRGLINANILENTAIFQTIDYVIYAFHMPLFFFISGILLEKNVYKKSIRSFFDKQIKVSLFLYVLWSFIQILITATMSSYTNNLTYLDRAMSILWQPYAQFWFLYILMITTSSAYIVLRLYQKYFMPVLCISLVLYLWSDIINFDLLKLFSENFIFVLLGCSFRKYHLEKLLFRKEIAFFFTFVVISLHLSGIFFEPLYFYEQKTSMSFLLSISSVILVYIASQKIIYYTPDNLINRFIIMLGTNSLIIYLLHVIFCSGARIILSKVMNLYNIEVHIIIGMTLGIGTPLLMRLLLEKSILGSILVNGLVKKHSGVKR